MEKVTLEQWKAETIRALVARAVQLDEAAKQARRQVVLTVATFAGWPEETESRIRVALEPTGEVTAILEDERKEVIESES